MPVPRCRSRTGAAPRSTAAVQRLLPVLAVVLPMTLASVAVASLPGGNATASGARDGAVVSFAVLPGSTIIFHASDPLGGFDGEAPIASASIAMDLRNVAGIQGTLLLSSDAVTTGNFLRDVNAHRTVFEASRYPTIDYRVSAVEAQPSSLADGGAVDVVVTGRLRMHGVARDVVARGEVTRSGDRLDAILKMQVRLSDFGMTRPRFFTVVVADVVQVRVHLVLQLPSAHPR